ncbi:MAG: DUF2530 domain-containing protein [Nocardioidaceae bacterium]|nr:DUF2530 domain-containing protein [Nocardioidaceae bacterium]
MSGADTAADATAGHGVAHLEPLDVDGVHTVAVGSVLWLVAFLALLPFTAGLRDADRLWWLWTCLTGFGFGVLGLVYCRRRRDAIRRNPASSPVETSRFGAAG